MEVNDVFVNKKGEQFKIIEKISGKQFKIRFISNGYENIVFRSAIKSGSVSSTKEKAVTYKIGYKGKTNEGFDYEVIERVDRSHVKIRFLIDSTEKVIIASNIRTGTIAKPGYKKPSKYVGEKQYKNGHWAEYVECLGSDLCKVKFDDGSISEISLRSWKANTFPYPFETYADMARERTRSRMQKAYLGKQFTNKQGLVYEVVDYITNAKVQVKFIESGYTSYVRMSTVLSGSVEDKTVRANKYLNMKILQKNGLMAWVSYYKPGSNKRSGVCKRMEYTVTDESGREYTVTNGKYDIITKFTKGDLANPDYPLRVGYKYKNGVKVMQKEFILNGVQNIRCKCLKCGWEDIVEPKEVYNHNCEGELLNAVS